MKTARAAAILIAAAILLGACAAAPQTQVQPEPETGFVPKLDTSLAGTVTVYGALASFPALEAAGEDFRAYYPGVTVRYVKLDNYDSALPEALEGDRAPDIFFARADMPDKIAFSAVFESAADLSETLADSLGAIRPRLLNYRDGALYMLPVLSSSLGILVNDSVFAAAGVDVPVSFGDLKEACAALRAYGIDSPLVGYTGAGSGCAFYIAAYARLCGLVSGDKTAIAELNALGKEGGERLLPVFERVSDLTASGAFSVEASESVFDNSEALVARFCGGGAPMVITTAENAAAAARRAPDFEFSFHPLPIFDAEPAFIDLPAVSLAVNARSEMLPAAKEFLRFLAAEEALTALSQRSGLMPVTVERAAAGLYAAFADIPDRRAVTPEDVNVTEEVSLQLRVLARLVGLGKLTAREAADEYGAVTT